VPGSSPPSPGRHVAGLEARPKGLDVSVDGARDVAETRRDHRPVGLGLGRHEVEDLADALRGRGDDVEVAQVVAGVGRRDLEFQLRRDVGLRDFVDLVDRLLGGEGGDHLLRLGHQLVVPRGRIVADLADTALDPHPDRGVGIEVDHRGDPVFGDLVDGRGGT
jgi:hypothetical protein